MLLQACLNGARRRDEHPALPTTALELASDAALAAAAGLSAVHLHVKDDSGADTLAADPLTEVLHSVRRAAEALAIGVTTGAWTLPDPQERVEAIRGWTALPDFASVNWHEDGADQVAIALLERGVDVEAGLWTHEAVERWARSAVRDRCVRILIELPDAPDADTTSLRARRMIDAVEAVDPRHAPVLLHGEGRSTWDALASAASRGLDARIGLEDTLELPDGSPAPDNASLIDAARQLIQRSARRHR
ncbi:3-keto-5-aminohexanoate cleavage protein [Microbacterium sp. NPDC058342]|uniref:3-keto-5-aminohexanoate cleavage protein n=1 Tax=Microbacterium sp. NPDC058342 TaxID=3346454 RepID=UPI00365DB2FE